MIDTNDRVKLCDGYCCYCKLVDGESDPFPGLRRMFGGSCSGPLISPSAVEGAAEEQLRSFWRSYRKTKWGICGPIVVTVCSERLARCPLYPLIKKEFVWVPDVYMGEWLVVDGKLLPCESSRKTDWEPSFLKVGKEYLLMEVIDLVADNGLETIIECMERDRRNIREIIEGMEDEIKTHKHKIVCRLSCPLERKEEELNGLKLLVADYSRAIEGIKQREYGPAIVLLDREIWNREEESVIQRIVDSPSLVSFIARGTEPLKAAKKYLLALQKSHPLQPG